MPIDDWKIDKSWTLFLDRDGVINQRIFGGYVLDKESFVFQQGVLDAIAQLSLKFGRIIVVTNQQGIAKNLMTERNLLDIHNYMVEQIEARGGKVDAVYFASNMKGEMVNDRRKPNPSMALEAKERFEEINFEYAVMVGDTDSDILFGKNLGMKTVLIQSKEVIHEKADLTVSSLQELKEILC